jgi:hypothetical protein
MLIKGILIGFLNLLYSLINFAKQNIFYHQVNTSIINSYILFDDQICYCHNLDLLNKYYNKNVFIILNELILRHNDVEFILYHMYDKINIEISIFKIYILYDDDYKIIEFIGIDSRNKNLINL